jgi:hypothetical protein
MIKMLKEKLVTYYWFRSKIITPLKSSTEDQTGKKSSIESGSDDIQADDSK